MSQDSKGDLVRHCPGSLRGAGRVTRSGLGRGERWAELLLLSSRSSCGGNSLVVQWLGRGAFTVGARVQPLVGGTEIPQAAWRGQKKKRKKQLWGREGRWWQQVNLVKPLD